MNNRDALRLAISAVKPVAENPELEAELLVSAVLGISREQFLASLSHPFPEALQAKLQDFLQKRAEGMPLSLLRGKKNFCGFPFLVKPGVFIPRFDSEVLVYALLERKPGGKRILDLCAGTGALGISACLLKRFDELVLTDISPEALEIAQVNASLLGVPSALFLQGDLWNALSGYPFRFDAILCNPPYIPAEEYDSLPESVKKYEPEFALNGGKEGLEFHRRIAEQLPDFLLPGGWAVAEIAPFQKEKVKKMWENAGLHNVEIVLGFSGEPRAVIGQWLS
ncbi:MAG: peptide chain release factor N(5)-glutamine methyltransferase [bacterium JZ-2024 1]